MDLAALAPFLIHRRKMQERKVQLQALQQLVVFSGSQDQVHEGMRVFRDYTAASLNFAVPAVAPQDHFQVMQRKELLRQQAEEQQN